ncbi:adrenocortical dysplasia protein homolog isoform X2 [Eleutherodactylus coqui]|uniref:adrenocortical dysplasia protein homolog isoform X2 n=1 Tax=Eleutherodactylus coqui TaxID=57060 RepID=UPI003461BA13
MAGYHCVIGYPWIIDCLAKYDSAGGRGKPAPGQVVEFLRMPVNTEDLPYTEAVINVSDRKYYIKAVITKEAQEMLESESTYFKLADIKNKIVILKKFYVCFTAVKDLSRCEFYLNVEHMSLLPMQTEEVDLLNCNMEAGVRKKIKELWQNYIKELEINETSSDMNLSDASLTQLLMIANEEKFSALKAVVEECLELEPSAAQDIQPQGRTFWSLERERNQENAERYIIPVDSLLIPPHEEAVLEQMLAQPYSTALSSLSDEPIDEGPSNQYENPWNKLQSLCVSVATSSDSQPKCSLSAAQKSTGTEVGSDPDSSTPDIFLSDADVSMDDSPADKPESSPLMFSEPSSNPPQPGTSILQTISASSNTSTNGRQGGSSNTGIGSLNLIPLTQDSPQKSLSVGSKVQISPIKSHISESQSTSPDKTDLISLSEEANTHWPLRTRKASKRKQTSEDLEGALSDPEHQQPEYIEKPDCVATTNASSGEEIDKVSNIGFESVESKQTGDREAAVPFSAKETNNQKTEQHVKTHVTQNKTKKTNIQTRKPCLQFVVNPKILPTKDSVNGQLPAVGPAVSKVCIQEAPSNAAHGQSSFKAKEKDMAPIIEAGKAELAHHDGTPFQYKYKPPSEDFCACVNAIQIPAELCEWAVKMLAEDKEKVL